MRGTLPPLLGMCLLVSEMACSHRPTPFETAMDAAEDARRQGDFEAERREFSNAADLAREESDANEARYRRAASLIRQGRHAEGASEMERLAERAPDDPRSARAWLDAGRAWERAKQPSQAKRAYLVVVDSYPNSSGALPAARRYVALEAAGGDEFSIWQRLLAANQSAELDEGLRYFYARSLERSSLRAAILAYEDVARSHPLPRGLFTDEALYRAAELRRNAGDPDGALVTLELLLEHGGKSAFVGSYVRTNYVKGQLLKGRILRDDKGATSAARDAFLTLAKRYPKSTLVDDSLFEYVATVRTEGGDACEAFFELEKARPDSRFMRCRPVVCGEEIEMEPRHLRECEGWLDGSLSNDD